MIKSVLRENLIAIATKYNGYKDNKMIVDKYNDLVSKYKPSQYRATYRDAWGCIFASMVAWEADCKDIIPLECACYKMLEEFKKLGCYKDKSSYIPEPGDFIFYSFGPYQDDNFPTHIGIITDVNNNVAITIEGNYNGMVKRRKINLDSNYILCYCRPKYELISK